MGLFNQFFSLFTSNAPSRNQRTSASSHAMPKLNEFYSGYIPKKEMQAFITSANQSINLYNQSHNTDEKKALLAELQKKVQVFEYKFPASYFASSTEYKSFHHALFKEIQNQYAALGVTSLRNTNDNPASLAEIIANMSPEKADELFKCLSDSANPSRPLYELPIKLYTLYSQQDTSQEAQNFKTFLQENQISFLGGGNSKSFQVTNVTTNHTEVLKIDYRLDTPRNVEAHLRQYAPLKQIFAPITAERQVFAKTQADGHISRTLQVTEYYAQGDLHSHRSTQNNVYDIQYYAGKFFEQMANVFLDIQEAGCIFPDAKITNWLLDADNNVIIADTKSFLFADSQGKYSRDTLGNKYTNVITTEAFSPPEFNDQFMQNDSTHAFILGKNLYRYLAVKNIYSSNGADFDYNSPVFTNGDGPLYKALITNLVKPNPAERMPIRDAMDELFMINNPEFRTTCTELKTLAFGTNDPHLNAYLRQIQHQVRSATPEDRVNLLAEMNTLVEDLKKDPAAQELRNIIANYRENASWYTVGMKAKADRIEQAMAKIPLDERRDLLKSAKTQEVMEALASHRYFGKREAVYLNPNGGVDPEKAATTFKNYKKQFNIQTDHLNQLSKPEETVNQSPNVKK